MSEEDPRIVSIGDLRIQRRLRHEKPRDACQHTYLELDPDGEIVSCRDCGKQVTAYWALESLVTRYEAARDRLHQARQQVVTERKLHIHLIAAKQVEVEWKRGMAPCCPHCNVAILPEDGLGRASVNRQIELRRRAAATEAPP